MKKTFFALSLLLVPCLRSMTLEEAEKNLVTTIGNAVKQLDEQAKANDWIAARSLYTLHKAIKSGSNYSVSNDKVGELLITYNLAHKRITQNKDVKFYVCGTVCKLMNPILYPEPKKTDGQELIMPMEKLQVTTDSTN